MGTPNRKELDHLERRELQLTILCAFIVLVLAAAWLRSCIRWCSSIRGEQVDAPRRVFSDLAG